MATAEYLPPGIYRIVAANLGQIGPNLLTHNGEYVTVLPPNAQPQADQEWLVRPANDGNVIIERPSYRRPGTYLTYCGAPNEQPKEEDRVEDRVVEFPPNEWHVGIAPGFRNSIHVAGTHLGIRVAPPKIYPPFLELGDEGQLHWVFERIRDSD